MTHYSARHFEEFVQLTAAPDLLRLKLFPNGKEITESMGMYAAVRQLGRFRLDDPSVMLVSVGDGSSPRTAALFALRTAWQCHSVDPLIRDKKVWGEIRRLTMHRTKVENVKLEADRAVIVAVHSHARLPDAVAAVRAKELLVVSMPCCVPQQLDREPDQIITDPAIHSPHSSMLVWDRRS